MRAEMVSRYHSDGFVVVPAVLDAAAVSACIGHLAGLQAVIGQGAAIVTAPLMTDSFLAGLAGDPRLADIAWCLLGGAQPVPFGCTYFVKEPYCGLPVLWHQDGYPWRTRLGIREAVTLWLALDRSDEETGGLLMIPGTHSLAAQPLRRHSAQASVFGCEIDPDLVADSRARPVVLAPGDVSAHHPNLIHGSASNRSPQLRRGLAIRYRVQ